MSWPHTPHLTPVERPSPPEARGVLSTWARGAPQLEQNSVPGGLLVLQMGQIIADVAVLPTGGADAPAESIGEPQLGQYPSSGTTDLPHVGHT